MSKTMRALTTAAIAGLTGGAWVDMGADTVCRYSNDTSVTPCQDEDACVKYLKLPLIATVDMCKAICDARVGCHGIEYRASSKRCEIWMDTIGRAQTGVSGYKCYHDDAAASKTANIDQWVLFNLTLTNMDFSNMTEMMNTSSFQTAIMTAFHTQDAQSFANLTASHVVISNSELMAMDTHLMVAVIPSDSYNPLKLYQMLVASGQSHLVDVVPTITSNILPFLTQAPLDEYSTGTPGVGVVGQVLSRTGPPRPTTTAAPTQANGNSPTPAPGTQQNQGSSPTPAPAISTDSSPGSANLAILAMACVATASLHALTGSA